MLLSSHVLGEVEGTCDRAIFIRRGHLLSRAQASDLTLDATLERLYGAEALGRHWEGDASAASAAFDSPSAASSKGGRLVIRALFTRSLRSVAVVLAVLVAVAVMYIAEVAYLYDPEVSESLALIQEAMPELFAAFGMANAASTLLDFLINYLYGFLLTALLVVLAVYLAQRLLAGPEKDGSLAWLIAAPRSRTAIALTLVAVEVTAVLVVIALCWLGEVVSCEALFPGELDHAGLARANGGLVVLGLFTASVCLAAVCVFPRPGWAWVWARALAALFFLMGLTGTVGEGLAWLADLSPFALFDAYGLAAAEADAIGGTVILAATTVVLNAVAVVVFARRDFSL